MLLGLPVGYVICILIIVVLFIVIMILTFASFNNNSYRNTPQSINPTKPFPFNVFILNLDRKPERYKYVKGQLNKLGIKKYKRISATDGFNRSSSSLTKYGLTYNFSTRKGLAGCAASHIKLWKYIAKYKLNWTLILEDDAHLHPNFVELFDHYWKEVPNDAKIVFPGFCTDETTEQSSQLVIKKSVMCLQGYLINHHGAKYLLDNIFPIDDPIDICIDKLFQNNPGSYIFNGNVTINGIRPNDYKESNGRRCMFNGIIYQNHEEAGSTIHQINTVF